MTTEISERLQELLTIGATISSDFDGLENPYESAAFIQWIHDRNKIILNDGGNPKSGGFIMTVDNVVKAGDMPHNAVGCIVKFDPTDDNQLGSEVQAVYMSELSFAPMAYQHGWFVDDELVSRDNFDYQELKAQGKKPRSRFRFMGLIAGKDGAFRANISLHSTAGKDAKDALTKHILATKIEIKKQFKNAPVSLRESGWRVFWLTLGAGAPTIRASKDNPKEKNVCTPLVYVGTSEFIGTELYVTHYDRDEALTFDHAWDTPIAALPEPAPQVALAAQETSSVQIALAAPIEEDDIPY